MANRYWVGGTANWDATAGSKWSTSSGGAGGAAVPTAADDVFFDANSGAAVVTLATNSACRSLDCDGFVGTIQGSSKLSVGDGTAGIFRLSAGMTWTLSSWLEFASTVTGNNITLAGKTLTQSLVTFGVFASGSASWILQDAFVASGLVTCSRGLLNTNDQDVNVGQLLSLIHI